MHTQIHIDNFVIMMKSSCQISLFLYFCKSRFSSLSRVEMYNIHVELPVNDSEASALLIP